jgi:PAS domain-containing protein
MRSPHPATAQLPAGTPPAPQHTSMLATGFEDSLLGMALGRTDGRFLQANRALCRLLGRGEEELTTLSQTDVPQHYAGCGPARPALR